MYGSKMSRNLDYVHFQWHLAKRLHPKTIRVIPLYPFEMTFITHCCSEATLIANKSPSHGNFSGVKSSCCEGHAKMMEPRTRRDLKLSFVAKQNFFSHL